MLGQPARTNHRPAASLQGGARLQCRCGYNSKFIADSEMFVARRKPGRKIFHASVQVTRIEDWCVEAETEEEARALLVSGAGERCGIGDRVYIEVQTCSE
jgi:hypothetical protein